MIYCKYCYYTASLKSSVVLLPVWRSNMHTLCVPGSWKSAGKLGIVLFYILPQFGYVNVRDNILHKRSIIATTYKFPIAPD